MHDACGPKNNRKASMAGDLHGTFMMMHMVLRTIRLHAFMEAAFIFWLCDPCLSHIGRQLPRHGTMIHMGLDAVYKYVAIKFDPLDAAIYLYSGPIIIISNVARAEGDLTLCSPRANLWHMGRPSIIGGRRSFRGVPCRASMRSCAWMP